jgi:tetratricopeptide (TPR) repeat protein
LAQLSDDLKDPALKKRSQDLQIAIANAFLMRSQKDIGFLSQSEVTLADLYATLGDAYESIDPVKSRSNFSLAAAAYEKEILKSGIPLDKERGNNIERAYCLYKSGQVAQALSLYQSLETAYPQEFTFYYDHASVLQKMDQKEAALDKAQQALKFSYGDNQLRAAYLVADLQSKLGKKKEAMSLDKETLEKFPLDKSLKIRSSRYLDKLQQLKSQL